MTNAYILLKDLPGVKAGTKSEISGGWYAFKSDTDQHNYAEGEVNAHPDWFFKQTEAPPLGIIPEWLHKEKRLNDLEEAIRRYIEAREPVPLAWISEAEGIKSFLKWRKENEEYTQDDLRKAFEAGRKMQGEWIGRAKYPNGDCGNLYSHSFVDFDQYLKSITI